MQCYAEILLTMHDFSAKNMYLLLPFVKKIEKIEKLKKMWIYINMQNVLNESNARGSLDCLYNCMCYHYRGFSNVSFGYYLLTVVTKVSSVARLQKLSNVDLG